MRNASTTSFDCTGRPNQQDHQSKQPIACIPMTYKNTTPTHKDQNLLMKAVVGGSAADIIKAMQQDVSQQLEKLANLFEKGLLTEAEFISAKQKLLG